jgi:hypothetical protein
MGWARSAYGGEEKCITGFWWGKLSERYYLEGRIILRWIFRSWDVGSALDQAGSGQGQVEGTCECNNEPSGFIKWEFLH